MNIGNALRRLIDEKDMTQKQLALDLNIAPSTLGGYVQNSSEPDFATLILFAEYFNVSTDYLLGIKSSQTRTYQEEELLRIFRGMTAEQKELYIEQGKVFIRANNKSKEKSS